MKNIAFFSDGTWNGPEQDDNGDGIADPTNVLKLYNEAAGNTTLSTLRLRNEQEKSLAGADGETAQVAKYIHGVGDSGNLLAKILGGTFGAGLVHRIVRGYTFVCRNYQPGDAIYLVGFSRGAYIARALGGMIASVGLLDSRRIDFNDADGAYRYGIAAWTRYRRAAKKRGSLLDYLDEYKAATITPDLLIGDAKIKAIGVWDTVGSLGIPAYSADDRRVDLFRFADHALSPSVAHGFHALAIDEQRADFSPTRWDPRPGVEERWFIGAHADVGGGYAEAGLSDIALEWLKSRLMSVGLLFSRPANCASRMDELAPMHSPWDEPLWRAAKRYVRDIPFGAQLDESVRRRLAIGRADYPTAALRRHLALPTSPVNAQSTAVAEAVV